MLVVKVELWSGGVGGLHEPIGTLHIGNLSNLADVSDYRVVAMEVANPLTGEPPGTADFKVMGHPRRQRVWSLLQRACEEAMKADWVDLPSGRRPGPKN
ncbi:hypothetical protein [Bradyrhizobium diazoefficiens]|uniref:Uncharacterized protein n=1 Tax=Bradyrhizobium diazoefficiens TaxID=1355477 RepID=A0A810AJ24_9BRAD|nr:hypothetical protein [Bradyrhizobium diazoefficiens]WLA72244.1 hypothetical protein QIH77_35970 [Bradyrhizobium diazoefficiens]BBZ92741.1 hypothetical protein F07S3_25740 [Bradyrhizobium diazoefficiens]BCA10492.1 hypothetical protein BDHF08_23390 [Bradyrhizobium diazoefficiens]BCE19814.1 hypothetical protein XF1B_24950 [Bradyrhizobium diazoefficiens]BCE46067.1 hypothetical protein XF4B_24160 [Bradyrhizobium diazoefficiens]